MTAAKYRTRDMVLTALCTALIAVCAQIAVPLPSQVPMTLHTFAVALCGFLLAPKFAALSMVVYLLLGAVGIPVFAGFRGGAAVLFGPTGGFLVGFLLMAVLCALSKRRLFAPVLGIIGLLVMHACGVVQYVLLMHTTIPAAVTLVSLPFLLKDVISVGLAWLLAERLRRVLHI